MYEPISKLTFSDKEFNDCGMGTFQNKRLSSVFKDENNKPYYLNSIVFYGEEEYNSFTGSINDVSFGEINSSNYIDIEKYNQSDDIVPMRCIVNVVKVEYKEGIYRSYHEDKNGNRYTYQLKNPKEIDKIFKYGYYIRK